MEIEMKAKLSRHHKHPISLKHTYGGNSINERRNIAYVPKHKHDSWHRLFYNLPPEKIVELINRYWISPDYELICRRKS